MRFLFFSPHTLIDSSSGAAKCVQTLFEELLALGHQCLVVTGAMVDGKNHLFGQVLAATPVQSFTISDSTITIPLRKMNYRGVEHLILGAKAHRADELLAYEEVVLKTLFTDQFDAFQPDVLVTYGGYTSNFFAGQYALMRGRRSVLFAASETYRRPGDFMHVNLVASISRTLTAKLAQVTTVPIVSLKSLVRRSDALAENREAEFITFINPIFAKGLKVATAIALECQRRGKPYKFLFVESRGTKASAVRDCPELTQCKNVSFAENTSNIVAIYQRTGIILYPSLWYETAGRVLLEATANDIPVLASNHGGIPEMLDGAGYLFDPTPAMLEKWDTPPPADYLEKWLTVLDRLHDDPKESADATRRAQEARARYSLAALAQRFVEAVGG